MEQQQTMVSRIKKWMGANGAAKVEATKEIASQKKLKAGAEQLETMQKGFIKKDQKDHLEQLASEQCDLIVELSDMLIKSEIKLQDCHLQSKHFAAQNIVKTHMASGGAMALLPIPIFDFASLAATQLSLVRRLTQHYEIDFDETMAKSVLVSLFSGVIPLVTVVGLSSLAKIIPGIGSIGGGISMSVLSGALVYATGQVFIKHFEQGGTLEDFNSKYWIESFKQSFETHKKKQTQ